MLERKDATHKLSCRHCYCRESYVSYYMDCIILKEMPNNRFKILVFGDHFRRNNKKRIRYVSKFRVVSKND